MSRFIGDTWKYSNLPTSETELETKLSPRGRDGSDVEPTAQLRPKHGSTTHLRNLATGVLLFIFGLAIGYVSHKFQPSESKLSTNSAPGTSASASVSAIASTSCTSPALRREWRSLTGGEKAAYINSVQCLRKKPSRLLSNQSLYDDFPYVHMHFGDGTHGSAGFLPWHRYFVHLYETALRQDCSYRGDMPYWDWTLDWADFPNAPVWNATDAFGGDGGVDAPASIGNGRCVVDGPFADLQALYYDLDFKPHCFTRGFASGDELRNWTSKISPQAVQKVMDIKDFGDFSLEMEEGPHKAVPHSIRGEFFRFTAPYDPVFFLHHSHLDKLWHRWQTENIEGKTLWSGKGWNGNDAPADLADLMTMGGLAPDISAGDLMSISTDLLCYQYY